MPSSSPRCRGSNSKSSRSHAHARHSDGFVADVFTERSSWCPEVKIAPIPTVRLDVRHLDGCKKTQKKDESEMRDNRLPDHSRLVYVVIGVVLLIVAIPLILLLILHVLASDVMH